MRWLFLFFLFVPMNAFLNVNWIEELSLPQQEDNKALHIKIEDLILFMSDFIKHEKITHNDGVREYIVSSNKIVLKIIQPTILYSSEHTIIRFDYEKGYEDRQSPLFQIEESPLIIDNISFVIKKQDPFLITNGDGALQLKNNASLTITQ